MRSFLRFAMLVALGVAPSLSPTGAEAATRVATLRVFAAASLAEPLDELARAFERSHPGVRVQLALAGSQQLAMQIDQGAVADVFASADERWMKLLVERSRVASDPVVFARNRIVVIVPRTNPARIRRLEDLARPGVKLVLGAEAVPAGAYGREVLHKLSRLEGFGPAYPRRVLANVVSEEENVKSVVAKVQLGEADAGLCYHTDVTRAVARFVRVFPVPEPAQVITTYPVAVLLGGSESEAAKDFVRLLLSAEGQRVLQGYGFLPAPSSTR